MTDWQAIQDNYNAMNDISIPFRANPEDVIEPEQSMTPVQVQDRVSPQQNNDNMKAENTASEDDGKTPPPPPPPSAPSAQESLLEEFRKMREGEEAQLKEARDSDRRWKMGAALGDSLATILNAQSQMNVKAPNVKVQQGAGLQDLIKNFEDAPLVENDLKRKREELLSQYKAMTDKEKAALEERRVKAYEKQVGKTASKNDNFDVARNDRLNSSIYRATQDLRKDKIFTKLEDQGISFDEADGILDSMESGNEVAIGALGTKMARAMGEVGVLTDSDVSRYIQAASLYQGALDKSGKLIQGKLSQKTIDDIKELTSKMKQGFSEKRKKTVDNFVERAYQNFGKQNNLTKADMYERFGVGNVYSQQEAPKDQKSPSTGSIIKSNGKKYRVVNDNGDLEEIK